MLVTSLDGSLIFIVWGSCLSHCSMDLSYLLYGGVVCHIARWICHIYCMGGVVWCLSHCLMDLLYLLYGGVVCHIARWICHIYCMRELFVTSLVGSVIFIVWGELFGACHIA